jgi:hypothetical protein
MEIPEPAGVVVDVGAGWLPGALVVEVSGTVVVVVDDEVVVTPAAFLSPDEQAAASSTKGMNRTKSRRAIGGP